MLTRTQESLARLQDKLEYRWDCFRHNTALPLLGDADRQIVQELDAHGLFISTLDELQLPGTADFFEAVDTLIPFIKNEPSVELGGYYAEDVFSLHVPWLTLVEKDPRFTLFGLGERITSIIENYIRVPIACIGADLRRDLNDGRGIGNRKWHRDTEESIWRREVKVCIYLSDVDADTPCFEYIPIQYVSSVVGGSKTDEQMEAMVPKQHWIPLFGKKGTILFLASNRFYHHARTPNTGGKDRLSAWYCYTTRKPFGAEQCLTEFSKEAMVSMSKHLDSRQKEILCWY